MATEIGGWYRKEYVAAVDLDAAESGPAFKKLVSRFPAPSITAPNITTSGLRHMMNFMRLKLRYPLGAAGYRCFAMTARSVHLTVVYAYAYWRLGAELPTDTNPEYIDLGPTYASKDGEYRARFMSYSNFERIYEGYAQLLSTCEEQILQMIRSDKIRIDGRTHPAADADELSNVALSSRIMIRALAVAVMADASAYKAGFLAPHCSESYQRLLKTIFEYAPSVLSAGTNPDEIGKFRLMVNRDVKDVEKSSIFDIAAGQKLVPMFVREVMQPGDLNLGAWREVAVSQAASDLVINYVCSGFALYGNWTTIVGADETLFENPAMHTRFDRSDAVEASLASVREARRRLTELKTEDSYRVQELNAQLYESIEYAQSFAVMSSTTMLHVMQHVGHTLESLPVILRNAPNVMPVMLDTFADSDLIARLVFDLCYAAHCLHSKLGVVHSDLHTNNMTLHHWGPVDKADSKLVFTPLHENPVVAFVAGPRGEADTYMMPATGTSGTIIDFSRAILGPAFQSRLVESRGEQYARNIYRDQTNRVMRALHRRAGMFVEKHQEAIKGMVIANFDAVFPVLCLIDFIAIGDNLAELFRMIPMTNNPEKDRRPILVADNAVALARRLSQVAQEMLVGGLHGLVAADLRSSPQPAKYPGDAILGKLFGERRYPRWSANAALSDGAEIVDAYNYNLPLRYSGSEYAKFPPWAQLSEIEKHLGPLKLEDVFSRGAEPFLESLQPDAHMDILAERLRAEQERLDGPPMATASSWIGE